MSCSRSVPTRAKPRLNAKLVPSKGCLFGGRWHPRGGRSNESGPGSEVEYIERLLGRNVVLDRRYYQWDDWPSKPQAGGRRTPVRQLIDILKHGRIPVFSIYAIHGRRRIAWSDIASGAEDETIDNIAARVREVFDHPETPRGATAIFSPFHEPRGASMMGAPGSPAISLVPGGSLAEGTAYTYRVAARGRLPESVAAATGPETVTPNDESRTPRLTWAPSRHATGYRVFRSGDRGSSWAYFDVGNVTSWDDAGQKGGSRGSPLLTPDAAQRNGSPADFVAAYQRMYERLMGPPGHLVGCLAWTVIHTPHTFLMDAANKNPPNEFQVMDWWPGDDLVDWVGDDPYVGLDGPARTWRPLSSVHAFCQDWLAAQPEPRRSKPVLIAETGVWESKHYKTNAPSPATDEDRPARIREFREWAKSTPSLKGLMWFNRFDWDIDLDGSPPPHDDDAFTPRGSVRWTVTPTPKAVDALADVSRDPHFNPGLDDDTDFRREWGYAEGTENLSLTVGAGGLRAGRRAIVVVALNGPASEIRVSDSEGHDWSVDGSHTNRAKTLSVWTVSTVLKQDLAPGAAVDVAITSEAPHRAASGVEIQGAQHLGPSEAEATSYTATEIAALEVPAKAVVVAACAYFNRGASGVYTPEHGFAKLRDSKINTATYSLAVTYRVLPEAGTQAVGGRFPADERKRPYVQTATAYVDRLPTGVAAPAEEPAAVVPTRS